MIVWILGGKSGLGGELVKEANYLGFATAALGRNSCYSVDLASRQSVSALCQRINCMDSCILRSVSFFVWNASVFEYVPLDGMKDAGGTIDVNILHPTEIIQSFVKRKKELKSPFHLVTIASLASWKARADMAVYCGSKAYQAQFSRSLAAELERDIPGSKITIALPAGMKTNLFNGTNVDASRFMEPNIVAELIWKEVLAQEKVCDWFNVLTKNGRPIVSRENFAPELVPDELPKL